jgi:beta-glucosidase
MTVALKSPSTPMTRYFQKFLKSAFCAALLIFCLASGAFAQQPAAENAAKARFPFQDKALSAQQRTEDLLKRLTPEEKIQLLGGYEFFTMPISRLGIPSFIMSDGPQGVRTFGKGCAFPCGSALAATWDGELAKRYGEQLGLEARARGVHFLLGPGMNICRVAVNGRNYEYFGEDPFLASTVAVGYVEGVQSKGVAATIKHFAGNNQEWQRRTVDAEIDERALQEIYFPSFKRCIQEGGAWAIMDAYNRLNGNYCTDSAFLQKQILRNEWGFKGLVMSDWSACHSVTSVANGMDLEMPRARNLFEDAVKAAMTNGQVSQNDIDGAVRHSLFTEFSMGFFDRPQKLENLPIDSEASSKTALDIARSAIVLLKNEKGILPLDRAKIRSIAVYGSDAVNTPISGSGSGHADPYHKVDYLDGIRAAAGDKVSVTYEEMPEADPAMFAAFPCAHVSADGAPGLKFTAELTPPNHSDSTTSGTQSMESVESCVNLSWTDKNRPFGIPVGREATLAWTGVLVAPEDGDWELVRSNSSAITNRGNAHPDICIGTRPPQFKNVEVRWMPGDGVHLLKGQPLPITIRWHLNGRGAQAIKVGLRPIPAVNIAPAKQADIAIVCIGRTTGEGNDSFFEIPLVQQRLVKAVVAANPHTIVVNTSGAGLDLADISERVPALVQAWFLGQEAGTALGDVLFGRVSPSGRLPMTFDRKLNDNAAMANYPGEIPQDPNLPPVVHYGEGIFVGYRGYDKSGKTPLFPFGYGLSYTTFKFANLKVDSTANGAKASLEVTNSGNREGTEVVQLYIGQPKASVERPVRELKGFAKIALKPGETKQVDIELPRDSFAYWSPVKKAWTVEPGEFVIEAGASSRDIRLTKSVQIGQ